VRVIKGIVSRSGNPAPAQLAFLRDCARSSISTRHPIRTHQGHASDVYDIVAGLHATLRLHLHVGPPRESTISYKGREIVSLV
jgi:hypothetical protein